MLVRRTCPLLLSLTLLAACGGATQPPLAEDQQDSHRKNASAIRHVVVLTMENRSFDHFLGWVPGADGKQAGLTYTDRAGLPHATHPLAPDYQGCLHPDPD